MSKKRFSIERVLTVASGFCLGEGVGCAQDVFDHLYPGIMTLGCAAMQPKAAKEIERQHPRIAELRPINRKTRDDWKRYLDDARVTLGNFLEVDGPVADGPPTGVELELSEIGRLRA